MPRMLTLTDQLKKEGYRRVLEWRLTRNTQARWRELMEQLDWYPPDSNEQLEIKDQIRSLPGHPIGTDERDWIEQVIVDFQV